MLLSARADDGTVAAQLPIDTKTNEIPMFAPLLDRIDDLAGTVVTGDQLHTQRNHATYLRQRGAHYVFTVGQNQPRLYGPSTPCRGPTSPSTTPTAASKSAPSGSSTSGPSAGAGISCHTRSSEAPVPLREAHGGPLGLLPSGAEVVEVEDAGPQCALSPEASSRARPGAARGWPRRTRPGRGKCGSSNSHAPSRRWARKSPFLVLPISRVAVMTIATLLSGA